MWEGLAYRALDDPGPARALFDFAAVSWPDDAEAVLGWGAFATGTERLIGAVAAEQEARSVMLHGPVVVVDGGPTHVQPLDVAAQLVAAILDHAVAAGAHTLFTRPQGLDRVWIRFGFIPVPEGFLPVGLAGRAGTGLYAWRGGSALWSPRDVAAG